MARLIAERYGSDAELVLLGQSINQVFRAGNLVIRVADTLAAATRQVLIHRALASLGIAVATPLDDAATVGKLAVTVWPFIEADGGDPDYAGVGRTVRQLHDLDSEAVTTLVDLPRYHDFEWLDIEANLASLELVADVATEELAALEQAWERLKDWRREVGETAGPMVVCHGDVHPDNIRFGKDGPVLIDWDNLCLGPREWDHAALAAWPHRWGGGPDTYIDFAEGYGDDLSATGACMILSTVRLLAPTVNLGLRLSDDPHRAEELHTRVRYWIDGPSAPQWSPHSGAAMGGP